MSLRDLLEQQIQQKMMQDQIDRDVAVQFTPSAGQVANVTGMLVPGAGIKDAKGEYPALPSYDQPVTEAFSQEPYPSMAENLKRGGFGGYFDASMQGLGVAGDALYAAPVAGTFLGATIGTGLKGLGALGTVAKAAATGSKAGKGGKGITALDETKRMLQADIDTFAKDDLGFTSPTMEALITKAPANLKGKQITEWAKSEGAPNKGVKPKELEFLGLDEFVASNPNANVRETVEGISGNKVKVTSNIRGGGEKTMGFQNTTPLEDPLDGSLVYQSELDNLKADINDGFKPDNDILRIYNAFSDEYGVAPIESFADMQKVDNEVLEASIDRSAKNNYMEDPYQKITPTGTDAADDTFAFGNDEVGYQLFVDGNRVTNKDNIAYSETEAQIQLRDSMSEQGYDFVRLEADEFDPNFDQDIIGGTQYKQYIDNSLPGGSNYREVVFNWDNAPVRHNVLDHFDDDNQIAHALIRDRKLADGTNTLHGDEIQSDLHTKGSKDGYATPEFIDPIKSQLKIKEQEILKQADIVEDMLVKKGIYQTTKPTTRKSTQEILDYPTSNDIKNITIADHLEEIRSFNKKTPDDFDITYDDSAYAANELRDYLRNQQVPKDADTYNPLTDFQFIDDEFELLNKLSSSSGQANRLQYKLDNLVPYYPYKDDYFDLALKKMLLLAIEEGKPAISISGSAPMKARYTEEYAKFYESLYDKKIPSAMKKLSNKYGGRFEKKGSLDLPDTFGGSRKSYSEVPDFATDNLEANVIRITPEMKEKILKEGIQSFGTGGIVESGITHLNTSKKKTDGIVAIATA